MARYEVIANAISSAVANLKVDARVVRVSPSGCKVLSNNSLVVAELLNRQFCESVVTSVLSSDLVLCQF